MSDNLRKYDENNDFEKKISKKEELNLFENTESKFQRKNYWKLNKKRECVWTINNLYSIAKNVETIIDSNKYNDSNSLKFLSLFKKKVFKKLYSEIIKCEKICFNDKYSSLNSDIVISLRHVTKFYTSPSLTNKVLEDINLDLYKGDFVIILGPSGSGKTSLMNIISGIDKPTYGSVNVSGFVLENLNDVELTNFRKDIIGYVFQRYGLLPNLTAKENVLMCSYLGKNTFSQKIYELEKNNNQLQSEFFDLKESSLANKLLDIVGLLHLKDKYPYEMSGGQKQRVSIARTIAKKPLIIFGDELTSAVDEETGITILECIKKINQELNTTIIIVTHDEKLTKYANKVIHVLDGKIHNLITKEKGEEI